MASEATEKDYTGDDFFVIHASTKEGAEIDATVSGGPKALADLLKELGVKEVSKTAPASDEE